MKDTLVKIKDYAYWLCVSFYFLFTRFAWIPPMRIKELVEPEAKE